MPLLEEGHSIRDTYKIEQFLGEGAFAEVYRVRHRYLGWQALKLFKVAGLTSLEVEEMLGEAVLLSKLDHPNIVRVFDANTVAIKDQVYGYFTMEYMASGSLDRFWRSYGNQFVPVPIAVDLIRQVCRGLATAHRQNPPIIHRDIKPQNILVDHQPNGLRAKASDFGLARNVNPLTLLASSRGTRGFKAPEALLELNSDSRSGDVWAVGMTLYLLLTNRLPFVVPADYPLSRASAPFQEAMVPPSQINPLCDSRLDRIVSVSLAIDPKDRFTSAVDLLAELEGWAPKPQDESTDGNRQPRSTPKRVPEKIFPVAPHEARQLAARAIELAQNPDTLNEAADLMDEAFRKLPELRKEYRGRVTLWRRGFSM